MSRGRMIDLLQSMRCDFDLDFEEKFLKGLSRDALRHIILAAALHSKSAPSSIEGT